MTNGTTDIELCFGDDRLTGLGPTSENLYPRPDDPTNAKFDFVYNSMTGVGCVSDPRQDTASRASVREFVDDLLTGICPTSGVSRDSRHRPGDSSQVCRAAQHLGSQVRKTGQGAFNPAIPTTQSAQTAQVTSAPTCNYWGSDLGWKLPADDQQSTSVGMAAGEDLMVDVGQGYIGCTDTEQYAPDRTDQTRAVGLHSTSDCPLGFEYDLGPPESAERSTLFQTSSGFQKRKISR